MADSAKLFMKLTGTGSRAIDGESEAEGFERQIEIDDWTWSVATETVKKDKGTAPRPRTNDANLVGDRFQPIDQEETRTVPSVFSFSKRMDRSSTALMSAMTSGELLFAVISMEESSQAEFEVEIQLNRVRVIDCKIDGKNDKASGDIDEKWVFEYSDIAFDYLPSVQRGKLSVSLSRPAGSSTTPASTKESEILDLAGKFELPALEKLWDDMKKRAGQPKPKPVEGEAKGKGPG